MMMFADWGNGYCSFFANDCPFSPAQFDGPCDTPMGDCFTGTNCFSRLGLQGSSHSIGHKKPKLTAKRKPHEKPTLSNQDKLQIKELDDQIATFDDGFGNEFHVELWVYKVEKKKEGMKKAQVAVMGLGQQIDKDQLNPNESIITVSTANVAIDPNHRHVVWITQGAITYQVVLFDQAGARP